MGYYPHEYDTAMRFKRAAAWASIALPVVGGGMFGLLHWTDSEPRKFAAHEFESKCAEIYEARIAYTRPNQATPTVINQCATLMAQEATQRDLNNAYYRAEGMKGFLALAIIGGLFFTAMESHQNRRIQQMTGRHPDHHRP